uniref:Putative secreted protein n=1 Tax=Anopheles marajoara TaxID=58244 RepID=A0A2M4CEW9_9DIPT
MVTAIKQNWVHYSLGIGLALMASFPPCMPLYEWCCFPDAVHETSPRKTSANRFRGTAKMVHTLWGRDR